MVTRRGRRRPRRSIAGAGLAAACLLVIGLLSLGIGRFYFDPMDLVDNRWQTMIFTVLAFMQIGQAFSSRSTTESIRTLGLRSNPVLLGLAALTIALQLVVIYTPALESFFQVTPLRAGDLLLCFGLGFGMLLLIELEKLLLRRSAG